MEKKRVHLPIYCPAKEETYKELLKDFFTICQTGGIYETVRYNKNREQITQNCLEKDMYHFLVDPIFILPNARIDHLSTLAQQNEVQLLILWADYEYLQLKNEYQQTLEDLRYVLLHKTEIAPRFLAFYKKEENGEKNIGFIPDTVTNTFCAINQEKLHAFLTVDSSTELGKKEFERKKSILSKYFAFFDDATFKRSYEIVRYNEDEKEVTISCLDENFFNYLIRPLEVPPKEQIEYLISIVSAEYSPERLATLWADYDYLLLKDKYRSIFTILRYVLSKTTNMYDECKKMTDPELAVPDTITNSSCLINKEKLQTFLTPQTVSDCCNAITPDAHGKLDLTLQNIHEIEDTAHALPDQKPRHYLQVKEVVLDYNFLKYPHLRQLRTAFPNLETVHFKKCPFNREYTEEGITDHFKNDLWYLKKRNATDVVYRPLTVYLSDDTDEAVKAAFQLARCPTFEYYVKKTARIGIFLGGCSLVFLLIIGSWIGSAEKERNRYSFKEEKPLPFPLVLFGAISYALLQDRFFTKWMWGRLFTSFEAMKNVTTPPLPKVIIE